MFTVVCGIPTISVNCQTILVVHGKLSDNGKNNGKLSEFSDNLLNCLNCVHNSENLKSEKITLPVCVCAHTQNRIYTVTVFALCHYTHIAIRIFTYCFRIMPFTARICPIQRFYVLVGMFIPLHHFRSSTGKIEGFNAVLFHRVYLLLTTIILWCSSRTIFDDVVGRFFSSKRIFPFCW